MMMKRIKRTRGNNGKAKKPAMDVVSMHERDTEGQLYLLKNGRPILPEHYRQARKKKGAPSKYDSTIHPEMARAICARGIEVSGGNGTDTKRAVRFADLAERFGVTPSTVHHWFNNHEEFRNAVKIGRDAFDVEYLRESLIKKASGFTFTQTQIIEEDYELPAQLPLGAVVDVPGIKRTVKRKTVYVQPDMSALEFALVNLSHGEFFNTTVHKKLDIDANVKSDHKRQTIDWNKAIKEIGVQGVEKLVTSLKQLPAPTADEST